MRFPALATALLAIVPVCVHDARSEDELSLDSELLDEFATSLSAAYARKFMSVPMRQRFLYSGIEMPQELAVLRTLSGMPGRMEFVDYQRKEVNQLVERFKEAAKRIRDEFEGQTDSDEFRKRAAELQASVKTELGEVLLPHQKSVFRSLVITQAGLPRALTKSSISERLKVTDRQKERLADYAGRRAKELESELADLKRETITQLLRHLTATQKARLAERVKTDDLTEYYEELPIESIVAQLKQIVPKNESRRD